MMNETIHWLSSDLIIMDLGSAGSSDLVGLQPFRSMLTLIEIDAVARSATDTASYRNKIAIKTAIAGQPGLRNFYKRKFAQSSSFLQINPELTKAYGLQNFFEPDGTIELECCLLYTSPSPRD